MILGALLFAAGLLVALIPRYILPVCEYQGHMAMACSHTGIAEMFLGLVLMSAAAGIFFSATREAVRWLSVVTLIIGVSVIMIPESIGYCRSSAMPCHYGTVPLLRLMGGFITLTSAAGLLLSFKKDGTEQT